MTKHGCLVPKFEAAYHRLCQSGLPNKWYESMLAKSFGAKDSGPKKLSQNHIRGFILLWIAGLLLSVFVFLIEVVFGRCTKKM